jgi:hypothetical protein
MCAEITWQKASDPDGQKSITTLRIGSSPKKDPGKSSYIISAGSRAQNSKAATFYIIDPSPGLSNPWIPYSPDTDEDMIRDVQPATLGTATDSGIGSDRKDGLFVLSEKLDRTDCMFYALDPNTLQKTHSMSTLRPKVGKVKSIYSSRNPWG